MNSQSVSGQGTGVAVLNGTLNVNNSPVASKPAAISKIVAKICSYVEHEPIDKNNDYAQYEIENKLKYNDVIAYRWLIEEYGEYCHMVDNAYLACSEEKPAVKQQTLNFIKRAYRLKKGEALLAYGSDINSDLEIICKYSDVIIKSIIDHLEDLLLSSNNCPNEDLEQLKLAVQNIVGHAFVECSILEKPE